METEMVEIIVSYCVISWYTGRHRSLYCSENKYLQKKKFQVLMEQKAIFINTF
ncbi:hypothetical protein LguiB_016948 [Lonicera macranthoides]